MRRIIAQYFGNPQSYGSCEVVSLLQQAFEWENLSFELRAPWWSPNTEIDGLQSLQTNFTNASWAKVYVPIRPDFEEEALSWLLSIGAIPYSIEWLDDFEYYLHDMRANLQPAFERNYEPTAGDAIEIDNPCDIELTQHGQVEWKHKFEQEPGFLVLDRWIADIPTDGVDYEEQVASCDVRSEIRQSDGRIASAEAKLKETIASRVEAKDEDVKVSVEWPGSQS
jgi:hypothetical protein